MGFPVQERLAVRHVGTLGRLHDIPAHALFRGVRTPVWTPEPSGLFLSILIRHAGFDLDDPRSGRETVFFWHLTGC